MEKLKEFISQCGGEMYPPTQIYLGDQVVTRVAFSVIGSTVDISIRERLLLFCMQDDITLSSFKVNKIGNVWRIVAHVLLARGSIE